MRTLHFVSFVKLALIATLAGCTAQAKEQRAIELGDRELQMSSINSHGQWESAPWSGSVWIDVPGGATLIVAHPLGRKPTLVLPYLSFDQDDSKAAPGVTRRSFLGAGDVANLYDVSDTHVTIENRTQAEFYLRLVLE